LIVRLVQAEPVQRLLVVQSVQAEPVQRLPAARFNVVSVSVPVPVEAEPQPDIEAEPLKLYEPVPSALWFTVTSLEPIWIVPAPLNDVKPADHEPAVVEPEPPPDEAEPPLKSIYDVTLTTEVLVPALLEISVATTL